MQRIRVECNFGSRYFTDMAKARRYADKCMRKHLDVEVWLVTYILIHSEDGDRYEAVQLLLEFTGTVLPKY